MKKAYIVAVKEGEYVCIKGVYTNQSKAWQVRDELMNEGHSVFSSAIPLNEEADLLTNIWASGYTKK